jgi:hypothetical protein
MASSSAACCERATAAHIKTKTALSFTTTKPSTDNYLGQDTSHEVVVEVHHRGTWCDAHFELRVVAKSIFATRTVITMAQRPFTGQQRQLSIDQRPWLAVPASALQRTP